uniref:SEL1L2 adaptor subunit of ERAD E3 ligase n=1 Tax=Macrostomum lignano TaxID=282301 RepID=A0A1I8JN41_9PLAT
GNAIGYAGLGLMHLQGAGVPASPQKAEEFFGRSAELGYAEGQLQLGLMHYTGITQAGIRDLKKALKYFTLASQQGNTLAFFYLAQMHAAGSGVLRSCQTRRRVVQECGRAGRWSDQLMEAHRLYKEESGSAYAALLRYLFLADSGYEVAQSNAAYILDQNPEAFFPANESYSRAASCWSRAAGQSYAQARLKLADYHYYGLGGPANLEQAASLYRAASDQQSSAQAMFNLAYIGAFGLERDLHLAKRYYDQAAEASADAYMPVMLALCRLAVEFVMDYLRGGNYSGWRTSSPCCPSQTSGHPPPCRRPSSSGPDSIRLSRLLMMKMENRQTQPISSANTPWPPAAGPGISLLLTVLVGILLRWHLPAHSIPSNRAAANSAGGWGRCA